MRLGIFAKTFTRPTVEEVFDAVRAHGLRCVQFNLSCAECQRFQMRSTLPSSLVFARRLRAGTSRLLRFLAHII